ncbi:MAG TPA: hypothetical protein VFD66_00620 [Verrucomicrobiae bacterium]|nr:hypothetical protein [Verrucomicrobiae bacterium]
MRGVDVEIPIGVSSFTLADAQTFDPDQFAEYAPPPELKIYGFGIPQLGHAYGVVEW